MIEAEINIMELLHFIKNLRYEDKLEFDYFLQAKPISYFLDTCFDLKNEIYYLKTNDGYPLALGGVYHMKNEKIKEGQVWLLCTKYLKHNKNKVFKYVLRKIEIFKNEFDVLFNFIYKSNFSSLKMLKKLGFSYQDLPNISEYKLFYFNKGVKFDIRHFTS